MWTADPLNRPSFSDLYTAIKALGLSRGPTDDYSYTMDHSSRAGSSPMPPAGDGYMQPVNSRRESDREFADYADSPLQADMEPDIY